MNTPIRKFKDPVTGKTSHSINLHYGFNPTSSTPNRRQRRELFQKRNKNPFYGLHRTSKYVQIIHIHSDEHMPEIRVINHSPLWKKLKSMS